ncbi:metalloregulator ArsR/SmtB family transcription factor [uncultured Hoeflea sp.]|uniref:metalloregulator ArsR/SmtB family transcription factor n=1 Tax=uncultured Hoeflea sp. TaxID=538666 RepID=UPI0030DD46B4
MNDVYKALSNPVRREILACLRHGPLSAGALADRFDLAKPTLSGHFTVLKQANLIEAERDGTSIVYHLKLSVLEEALSGAMDLFGIGAKSGETKIETSS